MALDPNEELPNLTGWIDDPELWPTGNLPEGVVKDKTAWYAHRRTYRNGKVVWQFFKRNSGGGEVNPETGKTGDKVAATMETVNTKVQDTFKQDSKDEGTAAARGDQEGDTRGPQNGPQREVYRSGKWTTENNPLYQANAGATTTTQRQEWRSEGTQTGTDANGAPIYDNSRPVMAEYVNGKRTGATRAPTGDELKDWNVAQQISRNPGGKTDAEIAAEKKAADDKANVDADNRRADAAQTQSAATAAQSAATAAQNSATAAAAEKRANELAGRIQDPTTKQWLEKGPDGSWRPIKTEGVPTGAEPAGAPKPSGRLGEAAADLEAYSQWLAPQVRSGKITVEQADKLREARLSFWTTAFSEKMGVVNTQSTAFGQQIGQRNNTLADLSNRRSNATSLANQASGDWMRYAAGFGNHGSNLAEAIRASRDNGMDFGTMSGANRMVSEVQPGPAYAAVNQLPLPGGVSMPGLDVRPNAIGAGAVPGSITPVPSRATVDATNQATQAGFSSAVAPLVGAPAAATPSAPGFEQPAQSGEQMPVDVPYPNNAGAQSVMQPAPYFLAGSSRGHVHDPTASIQALIADNGIDNQAVRRAVAELYPGYDVDALLRGAAA